MITSYMLCDMNSAIFRLNRHVILSIRAIALQNLYRFSACSAALSFVALKLQLAALARLAMHLDPAFHDLLDEYRAAGH